MKQRKQFSAKRIANLCLQILLIPLLLFFAAYNVFTVQALNRQMYDANRNVVASYQRILSFELDKIELSMVGIVANGTDFRQLLNKATQFEAHISSYNIIQQYATLLKLFPQVAGLHILSEKNSVYRSAYNEGYAYQSKVAVEEYLRELTSTNQHLEHTGWFVHTIHGTPYLFRILWVKQTYVMCSIELDKLPVVLNLDHAAGFLVFFSEDGTPLTQEDRLAQEGIHLSAAKGPHYVSGQASNYFVVQTPVHEDMDIDFAYIVPYEGIWSLSNRPQLLMVIGLLCIVLLIPLYHRLQSRFYFKPLRELVHTINSIRNGQLHTTMRTDYTVEEFNQAGSAFNTMMEEINGLKILAYEKEMQRQRIEMQYLQIQIRPHFFLNCLKNLYGLAQQGKHTEIQEMIVMLSSYIRSMFRESSVLVPLHKELELVENYVRMQQVSSALCLTYEPQIDQGLLDFPIPQMTILTFVENAVKHGAPKEPGLKIFVKAQNLRSDAESFVNIVVSDNGSGFPVDVLDRLNDPSHNEITGEHIGIINVKNRLSLLYDGKSTVLFSNTATGACVDLYIPKDDMDAHTTQT